MTYSIFEQAAKELTEAVTFYLKQASVKVADRFLSEFVRATRLVDANPGIGTPTFGDRRIFPIRRFPYSLVYRTSDEGARISAVARQHRKPGYWRPRT